MQASPELRQTAYSAFISPNIENKMALASVLPFYTAINSVAIIASNDVQSKPGVPAKPELLEPLNVDKRSPFTPAGHAALTVEEAVAGAEKLPGPLYVVKAQIHAGGRGKGKFKELGADAKGGEAMRATLKQWWAS